MVKCGKGNRVNYWSKLVTSKQWLLVGRYSEEFLGEEFPLLDTHARSAASAPPDLGGPSPRTRTPANSLVVDIAHAAVCSF